VPVEMDEIDSMDKLDAALAYSIESKQPVIIDWYYGLCLCHNLPNELQLLILAVAGTARSPSCSVSYQHARCSSVQPFILVLGF
jgi:hypothetical protein